MPFPIRATYRVQLRPEFTLDDAANIVPYLAQLGISHVYASPFLQAAPGSPHGYDVVDYTTINSELGGAPALERLVQAEQSAGLGMILDMVPNHMAISSRNPWWWDVLANGSASRYAAYFDVDWNPPETRHANAVLAPVLGDQYGRVIDAGEIKIVFDGTQFTVQYHDHIYPVDSRSLETILHAAAEGTPHPTLAFLADAFANLPAADANDMRQAQQRYRDASVLHDWLAQLVKTEPAILPAIQKVLASINADPVALDAFLRRQYYRLAFWKISARELGYRRFFDINNMIGIRMEDVEVYRDTHRLVLNLMQRGALDGLRIDHPDGLRDPAQYFARLRADATSTRGWDAWIVIEKILEPGERLPDWPIDGTVGYEFLNRVNGVFIDASAEPAFTEFYQQFTGLTQSYTELVHEKKLLAAREVLGSDLSHLTELLLQICERHPRHRDYSRNELVGALSETAACLPVYRTYLTESAVANGSAAADEARIGQTIADARARRPDIDPRLFDFLQEILLLRVNGALETELTQRFQQFTGPVMAKGVEDTVFYIYNRFVSLNEVGGDPRTFGVAVDEFHRANLETQTRLPLTMLATGTHDAKRSEDVRARLNVLSEMPGDWTNAVRRWWKMNARYRTPRSTDKRIKEQPIPTGDEEMRVDAVGAVNFSDDDALPDRNMEYLIYQTLVGAWRMDADRAVAYCQKAMREAKVFTSWTTADAHYEAAVGNFVRSILADARFVADVEKFVARLIEPGRINSLAQTLLKLTAPGIPDIYQGCETWNLSLVDPDNRRPVDYARAVQLLAQLADDTAPETVLAGMDDGLPKLWVIRQTLALRAQHPDAFGSSSSYTPVNLELPARVDKNAEPAIAFLRADKILVVVPRLTVRWRARWRDFTLPLLPGTWRNCLTGEIWNQPRVTLEKLWARFPVAVLAREGQTE